VNGLFHGGESISDHTANPELDRMWKKVAKDSFQALSSTSMERMRKTTKKIINQDTPHNSALIKSHSVMLLAEDQRR
jgi:hypothetical protein